MDYADAVPHLPVKNMLWEGWSHVGAEVYYTATRPGAYIVCDEPENKTCSDRWNVIQTLAHTCDHCSYLGMQPCHCGVPTPQCTEPRQSWV